MSRPLKVSFFDLDHTLLKGNCSSLFFTYLIKRKVLPRRVYLYYPFYAIKYHLFNLSLPELHERTFDRLLKGRSLEEVKQVLLDFLTIKLPEFWNEKVVAILKRAQHLGHYTVILSNSPSFLVQPIAQLLQVDEFRATEYEIDEKGIFHKIRSILDGPQKAHFVRKLAKKFSLNRFDMTAYSDSYHDLPLLEAVDHPVAVNPDKKLLHISTAAKWEVI